MKESFYISSNYIKEQALALGFDACGIALAGELPRFKEDLSKWLSLGYNAEMNYMEQNADKRSNAQLLCSDAVSVISVLVGYKPSWQLEKQPYIAQYAYAEDYHRKIKQMLFRLINTIQKDYPSFIGIPYVDTAPISDKVWAKRSGLGWIGKNTLLINARLGSWVNIGEIVCNITSEYDSIVEDMCKECTKCLDACPNKAITPNGINANKCIAYNTIENKNTKLPHNLKLNGYVFGCDICQRACPFNADVEPMISIDEDRKRQLENVGSIDEKDFKRLIKHTAMERIKYSQLQRNINKNKYTKEDK